VAAVVNIAIRPALSQFDFTDAIIRLGHETTRNPDADAAYAAHLRYASLCNV
jgi:hypothetical protein